MIKVFIDLIAMSVGIDKLAIPLVCENLDGPSKFEGFDFEKRSSHCEEWAKDNVTSEEVPLLQVLPSDPLPRGSRLSWRTWVPFM